MMYRIAQFTSACCAIVVTAIPLSVSAAEQKNRPLTIVSDTGDAIARLLETQDRQQLEIKNLDQMIGQMIMVGFHGKTSRSVGTRRVIDMLDNGQIGGVILMQRNVSNRKNLLDLTAALHSTGAPLPPFISIDQEGGAVQRLKRKQGFARIPSALSLIHI